MGAREKRKDRRRRRRGPRPRPEKAPADRRAEERSTSGRTRSTSKCSEETGRIACAPPAPSPPLASAAGAASRQVHEVSGPGIRQRERRHGVDGASETLGQQFGHVATGLVSHLQATVTSQQHDGMSGHHAGADGSSELCSCSAWKGSRCTRRGRRAACLTPSSRTRTGGLRLRHVGRAPATMANSLCGSWGCSDGVTTT